MHYFANPCSNADVVSAMLAGTFSLIDQPNQGSNTAVRTVLAGGGYWCADNGAFSNRFDVGKWWAYLEKRAPYAGTCAFAVAPDVVGDAAATLARSAPWLAKIRALGYRVAFVAQDGLESLPVPWDDFDCLFIGGSTDWKLGEHARQLAGEAKHRGKWLHMGRVNSLKRLRYAKSIGCDSVDGTYLTFGPEKNLRRMSAWLHLVNTEGNACPT